MEDGLEGKNGGGVVDACREGGDLGYRQDWRSSGQVIFTRTYCLRGPVEHHQ